MPLLLETEFRAFAAHPVDAIEGALLVSRLVYRATDPVWCRAELQRLAAQCGAEHTAQRVTAALRSAGFAGADDYYQPQNSALELVLRTRRGIPISLAMVLVGAAEALGLHAVGINFPNHFLVQIEHRVIDPFTLQVLDDAEQHARIDATRLSASQALRPATATEVVLRMLNNLRTLAAGRRDYQAALEITDYQMLLTPGSYAVHLARAELWHASEVPTMVREELQRALQCAPSASLQQEIQASLNQLQVPPPTLH